MNSNHWNRKFSLIKWKDQKLQNLSRLKVSIRKEQIYWSRISSNKGLKSRLRSTNGSKCLKKSRIKLKKRWSFQWHRKIMSVAGFGRLKVMRWVIFAFIFRLGTHPNSKIFTWAAMHRRKIEMFDWIIDNKYKNISQVR